MADTKFLLVFLVLIEEWLLKYWTITNVLNFQKIGTVC